MNWCALLDHDWVDPVLPPDVRWECARCGTTDQDDRTGGGDVKRHMRWSVRIRERGRDPRIEGEYETRNEAQRHVENDDQEVVRVAVYR